MVVIGLMEARVNWSSGNVITRIYNCCHGYKISIATKIKLASFYHERSTGQYELNICSDILFIVKIPPQTSFSNEIWETWTSSIVPEWNDYFYLT